MFSWVELLLAKTLTATIAKPIAAIMTRTSSTSGYELGLLAAAGSLTIIPGAVVIYFVRNYIAKGFAMGRVCIFTNLHAATTNTWNTVGKDKRKRSF